MNKLALTLVAFALTSCQIGPNYYELEPKVGHNAHSMHGTAYRQSVDATMLARDLTDQELDDAYPYPGVGYDDSKWCGENPDEIEFAAQKVWECDDGTILILEDNGDIYVL